MKSYNSILASALFAAALFAAAPVEASAGHGGGGGEHGHAGNPGHASRPEFRGHDGFDHGRFDHGQFDHGQFDHDRFRGRFGPGFEFRPRFGVGFGVFLGYPFGYPFYDPWNYWTYPVGPLAFIPGQGYGGVSFSISPGDAGVIVDGTYAGTVDQFNNPQTPLNLPPGQHHVQIQAHGYATLDFDVTVQAGQVVPYAGDLQPN